MEGFSLAEIADLNRYLQEWEAAQRRQEEELRRLTKR